MSEPSEPLGAAHSVRQNEQIELGPPRDVGAQLRALREARGLSQRALARLAGVTNATVSNIETNSVSPSVASLRKIVRAMGTSMAEFFAADAAGPPRFFFKADDLVEIGSSLVSLRLVGSNNDERSLQVLHERYAPGADTGPEMIRHAGEEAGLVIEGHITITVGTFRSVLGPGDAYQFPSTLPHRFQNEHDLPCVLVSASTPPTF